MDGRGGARDGAGRPAANTEAEKISTAYRTARALREKQRARIAELNLRKLEGSLCEVDGVRRGAYAMGQYLQRNLVDILPASIAVELAAMSDPTAIERYLRDRLRAELDDLARSEFSEVPDLFGVD